MNAQQLWEKAKPVDGWKCHRLFGLDELKRLQLDAMREGMRRAANEVILMRAILTSKEVILSTAEQLTEKDL